MAVKDIPTIDLNDPDEQNLVRSLADACSEWGIFYVVNHGILDEVISKFKSVGEEFFDLPQEEKQVCAKPTDSTHYGYAIHNVLEDQHGNKCLIDHLRHRVWPPCTIDYKFWPLNPPLYRKVTEEYIEHVRETVEKLYRMVSKGLGVEGHVLKEAVGGEDLIYLLSINNYPPCPRCDSTLAVIQHTDNSTLTILLTNQVPGLQVLKDGCWIDVNHVPGSLIVNIGDQLEIFSNGKYKAVPHRVTVPNSKKRMSWPIFLEPPDNTIICPLPQLITPENPPKYKAMSVKDLLDDKRKRYMEDLAASTKSEM